MGIYSVCSAHPLGDRGRDARGERASNAPLTRGDLQSGQPVGGYTGMTPARFRRFVLGIAARASLPKERVLLGGDHLGPECLAYRDRGDGHGSTRSD